MSQEQMAQLALSTTGSWYFLCRPAPARWRKLLAWPLQPAIPRPIIVIGSSTP